MDLNEIQKAVSALTPDDLARFRRWFETFDTDMLERHDAIKTQLDGLQGSLKGKMGLQTLLDERRKERKIQ